MDLPRVAGVFANRAVFSTTGFRPAGRALVRALGSEDENVRTIAGMFLVQTGRRAESVLEEALARRENVPLILTILGDIGDPASEALLRRYVADPDPETAQAAREALEELQEQRELAAEP